METMLLYSVLTTFAFYLTANSVLLYGAYTRWITPHPWLDSWFKCAACSGFWYGLALGGLVGETLQLPLLGLPGRSWYTPLVAGAVGLVFTPIFGGLLLRGLYYTNTGGFGGDRPTPEESTPLPLPAPAPSGPVPQSAAAWRAEANAVLERLYRSPRDQGYRGI